MTTDIKVGDEVIARSKTDPLTVVHGVVDCMHRTTPALNVVPTGHAPNSAHFVTFDEFEVERVTPEIEFGPGACIQSGTLLATRARDGSWFWMRVGSYGGFGWMTGYNDAFWREGVLSGTAKVHFYGVGVTPHESWPKVVTP